MLSAWHRGCRANHAPARAVSGYLGCRAYFHQNNAIIHENPEAQQHARENGERESNSKAQLKGKLVSVKDNIVTDGMPTTSASKTLSDYHSPFEATVVQLLRQNGATIVSKSNLDEFGMGSHSQHSNHGSVTSSYSRSGAALSPGGSSGGGAIAVASGQCWAGLGTDTGGSVRLPAAFTGVVGFKPSYGLLSRWGVIQYANSLDTVGVLARSVEDTRTVFEALNQYDAKDPTSLPRKIRERLEETRSRVPGALRIGVPTDCNIREISHPVRSAYIAALETLQKSGHQLIPVQLASTRQALSAYYVLAPAEASSNLAKYDGIRYGYRTSGADSSSASDLPLYAETRGAGFGDEVKRRILLGAYTLSSEAIDNYFIQAQKVRRLVQRDFNQVFRQKHPLADSDASIEEVDALITPTAPNLPPTIEEINASSSPVASYVNDVFTVPASLAGLPAISIPVPLPQAIRSEMDPDDVHFAGLQIIGQFGDDDLVLKIGEVVEQFEH